MVKKFTTSKHNISKVYLRIIYQINAGIRLRFIYKTVNKKPKVYFPKFTMINLVNAQRWYKLELAWISDNPKSGNPVKKYRIGADSDFKIIKNFRIGADSDFKNIKNFRIGADSDFKNIKNYRIGADSDFKNIENSRIGADSDFKIIKNFRIGADSDFENIKKIGSERIRISKI